MNGLRHIVLFFTGALLFASPPDWEDDPGGYTFVATIAGSIVLSDGVNMAGEGVMFGVFDEDGNEISSAVEAVEAVSEVRETLIEDLKDFTPHDLNTYLVRAVQELSAKVEALEAQISGSN